MLNIFAISASPFALAIDNPVGTTITGNFGGTLETSYTNEGTINYTGAAPVNIVNYTCDTSMAIICATQTGVVVTNSGTINGASASGVHFNNNSSGSLLNTGTISTTGSASAFQSYLNSTISSITNSGLMSSTGHSTTVLTGTIGTVNNSGQILRSGTVDSLNNPGMAVRVSGVVTEIINSGSIASTATTVVGFNANRVIDSVAAIYISNTLGTLTNTGTISSSNSYGIVNMGNYDLLLPFTLNNAQGATSTAGALTYSGIMPVYYNIILGANANTYGQLVVGGKNIGAWDSIYDYNWNNPPVDKTTFGIHSGTVRSNKYTAVISGVTTDYLTGFTGTYGSQAYTLQLQDGSTTVWDLLFPNYVAGPNAEDTLASMQLNAVALRQAFNQQSSLMNLSLSQDCTLFDAKNICASFTGTRSTQNGSNVDATTGTLVIAHRPTADIRYGGYINQNLSTSNQGGLRLERSTPGLGAFVNYTLASGLNVRGSVGFGKMDMETTRAVIGTAEAGVGKSNIKSQGVQIELNKAFDIKPGWAAIPYGGLRKVTTKRAGYSETASDAVVAPLSYADLQQTQTSAFGGIRFLGNIAPQTQLLLSAGVEYDLSSKIDDYAATGVDGLGSISMQGGVKKTRGVFSAALSYDIAKNERASIAVLQRQEAFDSKAITSVGFTYMKGF